MPRPPEAPIGEMEGFAGLLEHARLELAEAIIASDKGYTNDDLEKLSLYGNAIQSVKDAIAFRVKLDSM